jgi:2-methylcitrate dehydratase PrpD
MQDLGNTWWINTCYFKRFASARYLHGPLDLLETLAANTQPDVTAPLIAENIERIDVDTYFMAATMGQQSVNSAFGMRFSLPQAMATRIVRGPTPLTDDSSSAFEDPRVHELAQRIFVHEDANATAQYPAQQPSSLRLRYRDGQQLDVAARRIVGEGDCPLPAGALRSKFIELGSTSITAAVAAQTWDTLTTFETMDNVAELCDAWSAAALPRTKES